MWLRRGVAEGSRRAFLIGSLSLILAGIPLVVRWSLVDGSSAPHPQARLLAQAAEQAAETIRRHQKPGGYWPNPTTSRAVFERPAVETNTFVPAIIAELLAPVAEKTRLGDVVERARGFLRDQVEPSGLVRYHGRPGTSYLTPFVCVITPDADDTALAWRLAPLDDPARLRSALDVLAQYRTSDGLYRTWLARREHYECVDPGRDPNPADIGINMHVYLLLARHDPRAARALCEALHRTIAEDGVWVYYEAAPLLPFLREIDLARAGCPVRVPESRLRRTVPGQQGYLAAARLYRALVLGDEAPSLETITRHLVWLGDDHFANLRRTPPLLYHNEFTATVPRFHWSEDVGYALWLRLYLAAVQRWPERLQQMSRSGA